MFAVFRISEWFVPAMFVRVCVSIRESTSQRAAESVARATAWADLVEIRADFLQDLDFDLLLGKKTKPVIFTLRSRRECGIYAGPERRRQETILEAAERGADYIDVEYSSAWQPILQCVPREKVILSHHNFEETPQNLESLVDAMAASGAGILKVAVRARCLADNIRIARLLDYSRTKNWNLCALAMGREGIPSRILGPLWGSWMAFAALPGAEATAEGQLPADALTGQYRIRDISGATLLYGVVGKPLAHSLSPCVHNAAFAARGLDAVLLPLEAVSFEDFLAFHARVPLQGVCITLPFKGEAYNAACSLSAAAEQTGAVNTLLLEKDRLHGENTDVEGFLRPLKRRTQAGKLRAVVLGAGGAARAATWALRSQEAYVCVVARDPVRARRLADRFQADSAAWEELEHLDWNLMVNATPLGMFPDVDQTPVPSGRLTGEWVYDLVYNPAETRLLKDAAQQGCKTISGTEMFLGQAWKQQCLWCGSPPPEHAMELALNEALTEGRCDTEKREDNAG